MWTSPKTFSSVTVVPNTQKYYRIIVCTRNSMNFTYKYKGQVIFLRLIFFCKWLGKSTCLKLYWMYKLLKNLSHYQTVRESWDSLKTRGEQHGRFIFAKNPKLQAYQWPNSEQNKNISTFASPLQCHEFPALISGRMETSLHNVCNQIFLQRLIR